MTDTPAPQTALAEVLRLWRIAGSETEFAEGWNRAIECLVIEAEPTLSERGYTIVASDRLADQRLRVARFVAKHWLDAVMANDTLRQTGMSHPLAMVLAALDGETEPRELGLSDDAHDDFRAALARSEATEKGAPRD